MRIVYIIILLFASIQINAQSFAEQHYRFDVNYKMMKGYYNRGLYQEATQYIDSLKDSRYVNGQLCYFFARIYSLNNEFDKTIFYLEKAVKRGTTKSEVEKMYDLDKFRESHLYVVFEINYDKWYQEYLSWAAELQIDSVYYYEIESIKQKSFRSRYKKIENIDGDDIFVLKDSVDLIDIDKQDSINFDKFTALFLEKGFPTYKNVGTAAFDALNFLKVRCIDQFDNDESNWNKIKPLILEEMKNGFLKPFIMAQLEDLSKINKQQPQVFLSSLLFDDNIKVMRPEELNIRRRSVGLCPIEVEYWSEAKELPLALKEIQFK